jgi:hypothetical protein
MDMMELRAIGELVGGVAVIASLIYVGLQVRQSNNLAQGAAELEMGRMTMGYARLGAEGDNALIYSLAVYEPDSFSENQRQRALWAFGMWLHMAQAMFRQFRRGFLPPPWWNPIANSLVEVAGDVPLFRALLQQNSWGLAAEFRQYIEELRDQRAKGIRQVSSD